MRIPRALPALALLLANICACNSHRDRPNDSRNGDEAGARAQDRLDAGPADASQTDASSASSDHPDFPAAKERKIMDPKRAEENENSSNKFIAPKLTAMNVRMDEYTPLGSLTDVDPDVRASSGGWTTSFFQRGAGPHDVGPPPKVSFHIGTDLLRCEYTVNKYAVTTVETIAFAIVIIKYENSEHLLRLSPSEQLAEVNRVGASLFNLPDLFRPRLPSSADESVAFSTGPNVELMTMNSWKDRVDAGIRKGELYFLFHKKISQLLGFPGNKGWFSKEFREKHAPKRP